MTSDSEKTLQEKLTVLLPHLVTHNKEHAEELEKWAQRAEQDGEKLVAEELYHAAKHLKKTGKSLVDAISLLKGENPTDDDSDKCTCGRHPGHKSEHHEHDHDHHGHGHHHEHDHHGHHQ